MSRKIILITSAAILALGLAWYLWPKEGSVKNVPLRGTGPILFFGDSLVEGVGATSGHDLPTLLSQSLREPVLNYGVAGDTTRQGLARMSGAIAEQPRLVLILLGGNDFLQKVPRDETFANLENIVKRFQLDGAAVVVIGVRSGIIGGGADDRYEALAKKTESLYVEDILQGVFANQSLMSDAIHPNDRGYEEIATRILEVIKPIINAD